MPQNPRWISGKELLAKAGDSGLIPGVGKSPEEGNVNHPAFLPGKSHGQESGGLQYMGLQKSWSRLSY